MRSKDSFVTIPFKSILVIGMSDSGGFLDSLKSKLNDAVDKIKGMVGGSQTDSTDTSTTDDSATAAPQAATEPTFRDKYLSFIPADVWDQIVYYVSLVIKVIIPFLFAMIVANEMIIYKPSVRAFYFVLTWILCLAFVSFRVIILMYYILRWAFNKYKKSEGAGGGFFPTIYTFLPWSTEYDEFRLLRYLTLDIGDQPMDEAMKDPSIQKKLKNAYYLGEKMVNYFNVLESSNPFRGYPEYAENFKNVTKLLFKMHMPALEIDNKRKEYTVRLHRDGKNDEFIEIAEHSVKRNTNEPVKSTKETLHKVEYNKQNNTFQLVTNATEKEDAAKQASLQRVSDGTIEAQVGKPISPQIAEAAAAVAAFNPI